MKQLTNPLANPLIRRELKRPLHWARKRTQRRSMILMYHGVGSPDVDPWSLFVSSDNFADHMAVLKRIGTPMSVTELARAHKAGSVPERAIAVTFDDGYFNNLDVAVPILTEHDVPATVYAIGNPIAEQREFWWDELAEIMDPALYHQRWEELMPMADEARNTALDEIHKANGTRRRNRDMFRPVTEAELVELDSGIVEVGAHTMSHPLLPRLSADNQYAEIVTSKEYLEDLLDRPVDAFSYPFGGRSAQTVDAVARAGFESAVTTVQETTTAYNNSYELPRFDVKDWAGDEFEGRLRRWFRFA